LKEKPDMQAPMRQYRAPEGVVSVSVETMQFEVKDGHVIAPAHFEAQLVSAGFVAAGPIIESAAAKETAKPREEVQAEEAAGHGAVTDEGHSSPVDEERRKGKGRGKV
jgi:hypothetical protein